ncbi:hypothetical protein ABTM44_17870, partial [Acinetobacter baumannii]
MTADAHHSAWPAVEYEELPWTPRASSASRRQLRAHSGPYRSSLVPDISRLVPPIPTDLAADVEEASAEIARFDSEVGRDLAPFGAV